MKKITRAAALILALALTLALFSGCKKKTEAEKLSRSYNVVISIEVAGELVGKKLEFQWSVNGLNAGTKIAQKEQGGYKAGDVVNFRLKEEDLKKGMNVTASVILIGYDGAGMSCGTPVPLELEFGKVYYLRVSGSNVSDAVLEQVFPE